MERLQNDPKYIEFEKLMLNAAGFMPASDIADITLYGERYADEPDATLVIRAAFDSAKLAGALEFAKEFESDSYNGHTLMSWIDEEKDRRVHACIVNEKTIVMTNSVGRLKLSVDVMDDTTKAMTDESSLPKPVKKEAWAFAVGTDLGTSPAVMKNEVLNGLLNRAAFELAEEQGKSTILLTVETETPEQAQQALSAVNGLKAVVQMAANRRRGEAPVRAKFVAELASSVVAQASEKSVSVSLTLPNDTATGMLERAAELKD
jgi:hypothetical protein